MNTEAEQPEEEDFDVQQYSRDTEDKRKQKDFLDFSIIEEIAGTLRGVPHSSRIPSEIIKSGGGTIEVIGSKDHESENHEPQIIIHRTEEGEINNVEIICTCGKKILLHLRYPTEQTEQE